MRWIGFTIGVSLVFLAVQTGASYIGTTVLNLSDALIAPALFVAIAIIGAVWAYMKSWDGGDMAIVGAVFITIAPAYAVKLLTEISFESDTKDWTEHSELTAGCILYILVFHLLMVFTNVGFARSLGIAVLVLVMQTAIAALLPPEPASKAKTHVKT